MFTPHEYPFQDMTLRILAECTAVKTNGHFVYASGRHGSVYVDKTSITPQVRLFEQLCHTIAVLATHSTKQPDVVIGAICNRGPTTNEDFGEGVDFSALANIAAESYTPDNCPLCRDGVPINTALGHGATFLAQHR